MVPLELKLTPPTLKPTLPSEFKLVPLPRETPTEPLLENLTEPKEGRSSSSLSELPHRELPFFSFAGADVFSPEGLSQKEVVDLEVDLE